MGKIVSVVLLVGGLLALGFPVFLGAYDGYGIQVQCGNGYSSQLFQATVDDQESATRYVEQCQTALAHRRAWAIPVAALGALTLAVEVAGWARRRAMQSRSAGPAGSWSEAPDDYFHEAAALDRRGRPRRQPPAGTTL